MATTAQSALNPTWLDVANSMDPNGNIATIVELMADYNEMVRTGTVLPGNLSTGNQTTVRSTLPSVGLRALNSGVPKSKSTKEPQTDTACLLEGYSEIDKEEARINDNGAAFMASESIAFLEAMSQSMENYSFYGDTRNDPKEFMGLSPRYDAAVDRTDPTTQDRRDISYNTFRYAEGDGTTGENTSLWIVTWGAMATHYFLPKVAGAAAGFEREWLGQQTDIDAATGNMHEIYRTHYTWRLGLTVKDWRSNLRICNLNQATLTGGPAATLEETIIDGLHRIRKVMGGRTVIYCNELVASYLDKRAQQKANVNLMNQEFMGKQVTSIRGIPILQTDGILDTEGIVPVVVL